VYATGVHVAFRVFFVLLLSTCNSFYAPRGATATSVVVSYLITVIAGGVEGGRVLRAVGGQHWKWTMAYQALFMPAILCSSFVVIYTTAIRYGATIKIVPSKTIVIIVIIVFFVLGDVRSASHCWNFVGQAGGQGPHLPAPHSPPKAAHADEALAFHAGDDRHSRSRSLRPLGH